MTPPLLLAARAGSTRHPAVLRARDLGAGRTDTGRAPRHFRDRGGRGSRARGLGTSGDWLRDPRGSPAVGAVCVRMRVQTSASEAGAAFRSRCAPPAAPPVAPAPSARARGTPDCGSRATAGGVDGAGGAGPGRRTHYPLAEPSAGGGAPGKAGDSAPAGRGGRWAAGPAASEPRRGRTGAERRAQGPTLAGTAESAQA